MRRAVLVLAAAAALLPAPAPAAERGQFSITPARRQVQARPPTRLVPTTVANTTRTSYAVEVFPVLLRQTLEGPFTFSERPGDLRAAGNVLGVAPARFTLRPGEQRRVRLRWHALPPGRRSVAVGVVFQGTPAGQTSAVRTISRLLSLNFLNDPRAAPPRGRLTGLQARPDPARPRRLLLVTRVHNRGGTVGRPGCTPTTRIRDARGRIVRRVRWRGDVVVPAATREFLVPIDGVLPKGAYTAATRLCFGRDRRLHVTGRFRLVGPGLLPSPALDLRAFNASATPDGPGRARGTFVSTGTTPAGGPVVVRLFRRRASLSVGPTLRTVRSRVVALAPGARTTLDAALGDLAPGAYRATVTYVAAPGRRATEISDFETVAQRSAIDRAWGWLGDHLGWIVAAILALLLLLTRRPRGEDDEDEPADGRPLP